jgi:hypothetical protein
MRLLVVNASREIENYPLDVRSMGRGKMLLLKAYAPWKIEGAPLMYAPWDVEMLLLVYMLHGN